MNRRQTSIAAAASGALMAALVLAPTAARAQEPTKAFDLLNTRIKLGDTIWVTDAGGLEIKGKIRDLSSTSISIDAGGKLLDLAAARVGTIQLQTNDSLWNGVLWGALAGFLGGALACMVNPQCVEDDGGSRMSVSLGVIGAAVGAGIGAGIDAAIKGPKLVVYQASQRASAARLSLAPVITPLRQGLAVSFRF